MNTDSETIVYLNAKEIIDRRARNPQIWKRLLEELKEYYKQSPDDRLIVTEIGGGLGGLASQLLEACSEIPLDYRIVDKDARLAATARARLESLEHEQHSINIYQDDLLNEELPELLGKADLVIAQSMLDLVDLRVAMPQIHALAKPGALLYAPVTFNGFTEFRPPYSDSQIEYQLLTAYHRSMDERTGVHPDAGGSRAGWVVQRNMRRDGGIIIESGSSDWLVSSDPSVPTHRDFLSHFLDFFARCLIDRVDVPQQQLNSWLEQRNQQMNSGHLLVHIHNLDLLAKFPKGIVTRMR